VCYCQLGIPSTASLFHSSHIKALNICLQTLTNLTVPNTSVCCTFRSATQYTVRQSTALLGWENAEHTDGRFYWHIGCVCVFVCLCLYILRLFECAWVCLWVTFGCVCIFAFLCAGLCVCFCVYLCAFLSVFGCVCVCVWFLVSTFVCVFFCVFMLRFLCEFVIVFVLVCACVCVFVCLGMSGTFFSWYPSLKMRKFVVVLVRYFE